MKRFLLDFLFLYFIVFGNSLSILFSDTSPYYIKVRPHYENIYAESWLLSKTVPIFRTLALKETKSFLFFEFQNVFSGKTDRTKDYSLWDGDAIYEDYISKVNNHLVTTP